MERESNTRDRVLGYDEEEELSKVSPRWLREIVTFAIHTGARMGEILEITWKRVDLFRRVVIIQQSKTGYTKTVPLTSAVLEILKSKAKVRHLHVNFVFPSVSGTRISTGNLERAFTNAFRKAKIENLRFHDLRHTFASRLAMAGKDLYVIQKLLGHRDPRMVQRYSHHSVEGLRKGIEALNSEIVKRQTEESSCVTILPQSGSVGEIAQNEP